MFEVKIVSEFFKALKPAKLDDMVDKAHYFLTTAMLLFFCMLVGVKQIFGQPITCMASAEFPSTWVEYVNEYCFVSGTYVMGANAQTMPFDDDALGSDDKVDVSYYQWIPYVLAFQALCFYLPHLFWNYFLQSDIDFGYLIDQCDKARRADTKVALTNNKEKLFVKKESEASDQQKLIEAVADYLIGIFEGRQMKKNSAAGLGSSGLRAYVVSKFLNLINVFVQFCILVYFVGSSNIGWGFQIILDALAGLHWSQTGYFPRVSFCTFTQNSLAQLQTRSVQCVLMINMLNEKIFLILYFWFFVLFIVTVANIACTVYRYCTSLGRRRAIRHYLSLHPSKGYLDRVRYGDFQLGDDGLLLLRFIENNSGPLMASKVACQYYDSVKNQKIDQFSAGCSTKE